MDAATVEALLRDHLAECDIAVNGEGANYDITVIGEVFEGMRPVKKQQLVYGALSSCTVNFESPAPRMPPCRFWPRPFWPTNR